MIKKFLFATITIVALSCSAQKINSSMNDGYYIGSYTKDIIFSYIVIIHVSDSSATLNAYIDEKGMLLAIDFFENTHILPNTEFFNFQGENNEFFLSNSTNKISIVSDKGSFTMKTPYIINLKYCKEDPKLIPSPKYALYCYSWFYPHEILNAEPLNADCLNYIQNRLTLNVRDVDKTLDYTEYYSMIKDSICQYKRDFDNIANK